MILEALEGAGGAAYLLECAQDPKTRNAFLTLLGKVLPLQITGKDGERIDVPHTVVFVVGNQAQQPGTIEAGAVKVLARGPLPTDTPAE